MAEPINHDVLSGVATAAGEGVKWGAIALLALPIGGALLGGVIAAGTGYALVSALVGGLLGGVGSFALAPELMIGGGMLGLVKGGSKVSAEQQAFRDRVNGRQHKIAGVYNNGEIAGVQQGYQIGRADGEQVGFQKGQEYVVQQIQQHVAAQQQMAMQMPPEAAAMSAAQTGSFAGKVASCKCESKVEMVDKQREAAAMAAAAGAQVG